MLLFVETNCETVSLEQMQERYHFSLSYLNRIFKKETGITIKQYILDRRMEKARKMLEQTDLTVTEVAERMGYESSAYFITSFRKYYGITPLQARKEGKLSQKVK